MNDSQMELRERAGKEPPHSGNASVPSANRLLVALILGGITAIMDTTIVAIGMHALVADLDAPVATVQWVSTGYLLALASTIPFVSWAQARFGGKRLWLFSLGLFVVGSALCSSAGSVGALVGFRILQGVGGGIMFPLMQTLAMQNIEPSNRTKTMASISLPAALGPIVAPVLGGLVLNWLSWRWLFLINVPLGIAGWILALFFIPSDRPSVRGPHETSGARLDVVGAILATPALAGLLYGLSNTHSSGGFGRADVLIPLIGGVVLLALFVAWASHRGKTALMDLSLLSVRSVRSSSVALAFTGAATYAGMFLLPLYFQGLRGYSALDAALILIPQGVSTLIARFFVASLVEKFGARAITLAGCLLTSVATIPFAFSGATSSLWLLGGVLFVRGFGMGIVLIPVMAVAYVDIAKEQMPDASALTRIAQLVGGAFGTAMTAVVLTAAADASRPAASFDLAFWGTAGMTLVAGAAAMFLPGRASVPSRPSEELKPADHQPRAS